MKLFTFNQWYKKRDKGKEQCFLIMVTYQENPFFVSIEYSLEHWEISVATNEKNKYLLRILGCNILITDKAKYKE